MKVTLIETQLLSEYVIRTFAVEKVRGKKRKKKHYNKNFPERPNTPTSQCEQCTGFMNLLQMQVDMLIFHKITYVPSRMPLEKGDCTLQSIFSVH